MHARYPIYKVELNVVSPFKKEWLDFLRNAFSLSIRPPHLNSNMHFDNFWPQQLLNETKTAEAKTDVYTSQKQNAHVAQNFISSYRPSSPDLNHDRRSNAGARKYDTNGIGTVRKGAPFDRRPVEQQRMPRCYHAIAIKKIKVL